MSKEELIKKIDNLEHDIKSAKGFKYVKSAEENEALKTYYLFALQGIRDLLKENK